MTAESCQRVQQLLHAAGLRAFSADADARRHLLQCPDCFAALQQSASTTGVEQTAAAEAPAQSLEAADAKSNAAAAADDVEESARFQQRLRGRGGRPGTWLVAGTVLGIFALGIFTVLTARQRSSPTADARQDSAEEETPEWLAEEASRSNGAEGGRGTRHRDEEGQQARGTRNRFGLEGPQDNENPRMAREEAREAAANAGILGVLKAAKGAAPVRQRDGAQPSAASDDDAWLLQGDRLSGDGGDRPALGYDPMNALGRLGVGRGGGGQVIDARAEPARDEPARTAPAKDEPSEAPEPVPEAERKKRADARADEHGRETDDANGFAASRRAPNTRRGQGDASQRASLSRNTHSTPLAAAPASSATPTHAPTNAAEALLARYSALDGVRFVEPNGYYENTYVPGDPSLRALQARLRAYDRDQLLPPAVRSARLDDASRRNAQPFDPPAHAALGVYLSASERGLTSARRMLVQVGLQATPRYSGRRPAMNIGLVLDAREPLDGVASATVRALLTAFADARDLGDKLTLFASGPGGGELVTADAFRHGPLTVAMQRIVTERSAAPLSLHDTVQRALQTVRGSDDPSAPLGSSVVIVIAPHAIGGELAELQALAHRGAAFGVPVSVFGIGPQALPAELATLALAGQGNRRMLGAGGEAAATVDRELSSVARVVARAVRLRIRLAPGTRLVSVLGSRRLDEVQAQRVRDAENSIDQRISRNLGIERDRGEDEEGVQIVIPSFYAGDSHTVLLDVVAEGPGPIADVTVRYKDLVQLGNGVARESLWLPNHELARGALQRNVLKNLLAFEVSRYLDSAGDVLASQAGQNGDSAQDGHARALLGQALALLETIGSAVAELAGDRELQADRALVADYHALLGQLERAPQREFAADSLHFASLLKLQPRPEWDARSE